MKVAIIINKDRMTAALNQQLIDELAKKYNLQYDLFLPLPDEIDTVLQSLNFATYNACVIGGGDGTVRAAAQALSNHDLPLIVLPMGTFNFLAKKLNYPNNMEEVFQIIKNNKTQKIDLAEVNGRIVVNHTWIGFYYYILKMRDKHKEILGKNRFLKIIFNLYSLSKTMPFYQLEFQTDHQIRQYKTCLVFVGNNPSYTDILNFGDRKTLTSGFLSVTILKVKNKWQLIWCMISTLFSKDIGSKYIIEFQTDSLTITAKSNLVNIVIDGELFKLESPLRFVSHQKKLTVFMV